MRAAALTDASRRVVALRALLVVFFFVLAARAAHLTVLDQRGEERGDGQVHTNMLLAATRGLIVDRKGTELSITVHAPSVYVSPREIEKADQTARKLARALGIDRRKLSERLKERESFTYVARWVSEDTAKRVALLDLPGVGIVREPRHVFPAGSLAGPVLGFANIDGLGVRGIERQEDAWLRGTSQKVPVERDARRRLLAHTVVTPRDAAGGDVALTIDAGLQAEAETALREAVERSGAKGGVVISMLPGTGEILTLAEAPGFDPNDFRQIDFATTRCRAFTDAVEPGSTFKAFLVAGALEAGAITPEQLIDTGEGSMRIPGKTVRDHHPYGVLDPAGALRVSSNVAAVKMAQLLGREAHYAVLREFGFGSSTASGFPFESNGLLRGWEEWKPVDHATVAFGQGVSVTAVQLAAATATLASGGVWHTPRLVYARRPAVGRWHKAEPGPTRRVVSEQTAATVLAMMEGVVSAEGTGRRAGLAGLRVAGKTGTAQKLDRATGAYSQDRYLAWFVGAVPAEDPKIVIVVALDEPQGPAHGGGDVAAPLFARVAASQLSELGLATKPRPIPATRREPVLNLEARDSRAAAKPARTAAVQPAVPSPERRPATQPAPVSTAPATRMAAAGAETSAPTKAEQARAPRPTRMAGAQAKAQADPKTQSQQARKEVRRAGSPEAAKSIASQAAQASSAKKSSATRRPPAAALVRSTKQARQGDAARAVVIPDFRGETVAAAKKLAARDALRIEVYGDGLAVAQDPTPGTVVSGPEKRVRVRFSDGSEPAGSGEENG